VIVDNFLPEELGIVEMKVNYVVGWRASRYGEVVERRWGFLGIMLYLQGDKACLLNCCNTPGVCILL
jgi:hypothetical protein